jgi:hypothetical protein
MENFKSINWKEAKELVLTGKLKAVGTALFQINNQGEFTINEAGSKLYKRRHSASVAKYDLIATL